MSTTAEPRLHAASPLAPSSPDRNIPLGYLRALVTLLVVAHHAALAYHPFSPPAPKTLADPWMLWAAFPIVDPAKAPGLDLLVGWNDTFFMSLMFLLAGVFTWPSLVRKGAASYLSDRAQRLGIPFVISALLLAPIAYYPTYLTTGADPSLAAFVTTWWNLPSHPAGPAWFLWVLLAFGALAALATRLSPSWADRLAAWWGPLGERPLRFFAALIALSAVAYLSLASWRTPETWDHLSVFWIQTSRALHYGVYFLIGTALGAYGNSRGLLSPHGRLARRWWQWTIAAAISFLVVVAVVLVIYSTLATGGPGVALRTLGNAGFVFTCAASSLAVIAAALRFLRHPRSWLDSLSSNAYGIYLLHYIPVIWLQWLLLSTTLPGYAKFAIVVTGAVTLSWTATAALRRVVPI